MTIIITSTTEMPATIQAGGFFLTLAMNEAVMEGATFVCAAISFPPFKVTR
jgi:hypothetical protein